MERGRFCGEQRGGDVADGGADFFLGIGGLDDSLGCGDSLGGLARVLLPTLERVSVDGVGVAGESEQDVDLGVLGEFAEEGSRGRGEILGQVDDDRADVAEQVGALLQASVAALVRSRWV